MLGLIGSTQPSGIPQATEDLVPYSAPTLPGAKPLLFSKPNVAGTHFSREDPQFYVCQVPEHLSPLPSIPLPPACGLG